jgi:biotin transport system substrate-specific component
MSTITGARERTLVLHGERTWAEHLLLAGAMACVTGLAAQVRIPLPGTPVPLTGQVFAVLLCGLLLRDRWAGASQALYLGLGAAGMPWFSGPAGGLGVLGGPTGGYIMGFIPAAMLAAWGARRYQASGRAAELAALLVAAVGVIYVFGAFHLAWWLGRGLGTGFLLGTAPFVAGDLVKVALATAIGVRILPRP